MAFWFGETARSTALSGVGTDARISRAVAAVSAPRSPRYTAKRALAAARPELQRVVEDHQILDRERVVNRQLAGLGDRRRCDRSAVSAEP